MSESNKGKKIFLAFTAAWAVIFLSYFRQMSKIKANPSGSLPSFSMRSALSNTIVRKEDLIGKVWIANFIFTRCSGPCPITTAHMAQLQKDLPGTVSLVTFTVDPDWDTVKVLGDFARQFNADPKRWLFMVPEHKKDLFKLMYEGFKLPLLENPRDGETARIVHSTQMVLVDAGGNIRGYYEGTDRSSVDQIKKDVAKILEEHHS